MARINSRYCKSCDERKVGCHIKCFAYNVDVARIKMAKAEERRLSQSDFDYEIYMMDKRRRRNAN